MRPGAGSFSESTTNARPGQIARSDARPTIIQEVACSGNILSWRLVMNSFLRPFSPYRWFKQGICQLLAKECALSTEPLRYKPAQEKCG